MDTKLPVRCNENEDVALYLWTKRHEMVERGGISDNLDMTLSNAYRNICRSKTPIKSLKDLSQIKGIGKWIVRLMHGFFPTDPHDGVSLTNASQIGKKAKGPKRYVPQKNSAAYALLITLYRELVNGVTFMKKQELIDAAEASGLSAKSIRSDKVKGKPGRFGSSARDWYTGWNCMKTLLSKGLVAKSSCPSKFMLTPEGQEIARECLLRSGLSDVAALPPASISHSSVDRQHSSTLSVVSIDDGPMMESSNISIQERVDLSSVSFLGENITSSLESFDSSFKCLGNDRPTTSTSCTSLNENDSIDTSTFVTSKCRKPISISSAPISFHPRACTSFAVDLTFHNSCQAGVWKGDFDTLAMPPCTTGQKFEDMYDVILILDDRENFGSRKSKVVDMIHSQFNILVEVRRLPIGDGIWIVRQKETHTEYVLDFIVERKKVDDLCSSIRDNRYRDQKLRLQRCGLRKLIYLVEGDLSALEAAESIKTACFTTEILDGFDIQRTSGFADTVRRYGYLSLSIKQYYSALFSACNVRDHGFCPIFNEFVKKCQDLEKMTVSDVFSLQLMQVPFVTEEIALAVVELYPTLLSLARAYSLLEGDVRAQQEMLKNQSRTVSSGASKNIFKLVWGS